MKFQSAYSEKVNPVTKDFEKSKAKQSELANADINKIVKRHTQEELVADLNKLEGAYGQVTSENLMDAYKKIEAAEQAFMEVPSDIRKKFNQDAGAFIDFATNPDNLQQMAEWGLGRVPVPEDPPQVPPADSPETP